MSMLKFRGREVGSDNTLVDVAIPARLVTGICRVVERSPDFPAKGASPSR